MNASYKDRGETNMPALEKDTLSLLMVGTTHVLALGDKEAVIFYENEETAHMLMPDGTARTGSWRLEEAGYSVDWNEGPSARWVLDNYATGRIGYVDETGERRAELKSVAFGNPSNLPR